VISLLICSCNLHLKNTSFSCILIATYLFFVFHNALNIFPNLPIPRESLSGLKEKSDNEIIPNVFENGLNSLLFK